jgi:hypothetical protein
MGEVYQARRDAWANGHQDPFRCGPPARSDARGSIASALLLASLNHRTSARSTACTRRGGSRSSSSSSTARHRRAHRAEGDDSHRALPLLTSPRLPPDRRGDRGGDRGIIHRDSSPRT